MSFQISALPAQRFQHLFGKSGERAIVEREIDPPPPPNV